MKIDAPDIPAYLERIGYDGPAGTPPTLETLSAIQRGHACSIPFENLDVLMGAPMGLDLKSVEDKLVHRQRGGYCFEQNSLMLAVFRELGFDARGLSARVRFAASRDETPPRTHLFCEVRIDGVPWIADTGIGGLTPTAPIRMDTQDPQENEHDTRRVIRDERTGHQFHQILLPDGWRDLCGFTGEEMPEIDRSVAHWWTSTNPESKFSQSIMAALAHRDGSRYTLSTRSFTHRRGIETLESIEIQSSDELLDILDTRFGLVFPSDTKYGIDGL